METTARPSPASDMPLRGLRAVSRWLLVAGGLVMVAVTALIVAEIVLRQLFNRSLGGVDEVAGFALAVATAWSFAAVLLDKAHVRIDTLYLRFGLRMRAILDVVALMGTLAFIGTLVWYGAQVLADSIRFGSSSQSSLALPKAVPQALWLAGLAWFALVAAILLAASLWAVLRGDWRRVHRIAGAQQLEDELSAELEAARVRRSDGAGAPAS